MNECACGNSLFVIISTNFFFLELSHIHYLAQSQVNKQGTITGSSPLQLGGKLLKQNSEV